MQSGINLGDFVKDPQGIEYKIIGLPKTVHGQFTGETLLGGQKLFYPEDLTVVTQYEQSDRLKQLEADPAYAKLAQWYAEFTGQEIGQEIGQG